MGMEGQERELQIISNALHGEGEPLISTGSLLRQRPAIRNCVAASMGAVVFCVGISLCVYSTTVHEDHGRSFLHAKQGRMSATLELDVPMPVIPDGFQNAQQAFEAAINKNYSDFSMQDSILYRQYKAKVDQDMAKAKANGGNIVNRLSMNLNKAYFQRAKGLEHREMFHGNSEVGRGRVEELYTFGSPATAFDPLYDATTADGCIAGLRVYTKAVRFSPGVHQMFAITDPVAWITNGVNMNHPHMDSLEALQYNDIKNPVKKCGTNYKDPKPDGYFWIHGHLIYPRIMSHHKQAIEGTVSNGVAPNNLEMDVRRRLSPAQTVEEKVQKAYTMAHFTFMNYKETQMIAPDASDWGWHLVGRACAVSDKGTASGVLGLTLKEGSYLDSTARTFVDACKDHTILYQHNTTMECALVFEGSDDTFDWFANLNFAYEPFCGLGYVHAGFRAKLLRMVGGVDYAQVIRPHLKKCSSVTVAGHSLGGAQAELFTACANRLLKKGDDGYPDYRLCSFAKEAPTVIPPFFSDRAKGVFLRNKGNNMCMDIKGTMETDYQTKVILFDCEIAANGYPQDQQWEFKPNGNIVNKLSGKCMAPVVDDVFSGEQPVVQVPCDDPAADQLQWEITQQGLLKNKGLLKCVNSDMKMETCRVTDQQFRFEADGHISNSLSHLCLGIDHPDGDITPAGNPSGGVVVLEGCRDTLEQSWELRPDGTIRSKLSGLCMNLKHEEGNRDHPTVVLDVCTTNPVTTLTMEKMGDDFVRSTRNGKCLDVRGKPGTAVGSTLTVYSCEDKSLDIDGLWEHMPGGFIRNKGNSQAKQYTCVTVAGRAWDSDKKKATGTPLVLHPCKMNSDQKWEIMDNGFIRSTIGGQKCLDLVPGVTPGQASPEGKMWIMNCDDWTDPTLYLDMKFDIADGHFSNRLYQECLANSAVSGVLETRECKEAEKSMGGKWILRDDGAIQIDNWCVDVEKPALAGQPMTLTLKPCRAGLSDTPQAFDYLPEGMLRSRYHGLCTAVRQLHGVTPVDHALILTDCPVSTQRWKITSIGQIMNMRTGKCVDALRNSTGPSWWDLTEWPCDSGRLEQQWEQIEG